MDFASHACGELMPLIQNVVDLAGGCVPVPVAADEITMRPEGAAGLVFAEAADLPLRAFFTGILLQAQAMQAEDDVRALFYELSTTAFLGFQYTPEIARAIDELLAVAERIAFTMTASVEHPH